MYVLGGLLCMWFGSLSERNAICWFIVYVFWFYKLIHLWGQGFGFSLICSALVYCACVLFSLLCMCFVFYCACVLFLLCMCFGGLSERSATYWFIVYVFWFRKRITRGAPSNRAFCLVKAGSLARTPG